MVIAVTMCKLLAALLLGYYLNKRGILDEGTSKRLSTMIVNYVLPFLIISSVAGIEGNQGEVLVLFLAGLLCYCIFPLIAWVLVRFLRVPVTLRFGRGSFYGRTETERKKLILRLMLSYQDFRLRKIGTSAWLKETRRLVERLVAIDENDIAARLFQAQLLITEERYNEANWILDHVSGLIESGQVDDTFLAYYLYLTTLLHGDEEYVDKVPGLPRVRA